MSPPPPLVGTRASNSSKKMQGYSGADIDSICREAAITALRKDPETQKVTAADFEKVMAEIVPSITPDMEKWYQETNKRIREQLKPPMDIV